MYNLLIGQNSSPSMMMKAHNCGTYNLIKQVSIFYSDID